MGNYGSNAAYGKSVYKDIAQVTTTIVVAPNPVTLANGGLQQFSATAYGQLGTALITQPTFSWSDSGGGTITQAGLFTAQVTGEGQYLATASTQVARVGGSGLTVSVATSNGAVTGIISIDAAGGSYAAGDTFSIAGGSTAATGQVVSVDANGAVLSVAVLTGGAGYNPPATTHLITTDLIIAPLTVSGSAVVNIAYVAPTVCNDGSKLPTTRVMDIIKRAMRLLSIIESSEMPSNQAATDFLQVLNWMIEEWSNKKLITYYIVNEIFNTVGGKSVYSIGPDPSCDFNTMMPIKIQGAFLRDNSPGYNNDWTLEIIPNDRYQQIFQKQIISSYPRFLNFQHSWPYGQINLWPIPIRAYQLEISQWKQFVKFSTLQDIVCLPPGYKDAMALNLAVKMAPEYGKVLPDLNDMALKALIPIQEINFEPVLLDTDRMLQGRTIYNIYSDTFRNW